MTKRSKFGEWYFRKPRIVRQRVMRALTESGIPEFTIRGWMSREIVPSEDYREAVENVTCEKIEKLFPY